VRFCTRFGDRLIRLLALQDLGDLLYLGVHLVEVGGRIAHVIRSPTVMMKETTL
jgi:hypothetical protein